MQIPIKHSTQGLAGNDGTWCGEIAGPAHDDRTFTLHGKQDMIQQPINVARAVSHLTLGAPFEHAFAFLPPLLTCHSGVSCREKNKHGDKGMPFDLIAFPRLPFPDGLTKITTVTRHWKKRSVFTSRLVKLNSSALFSSTRLREILLFCK
ncbi:hypothetical protein BaRGS_00014882 [Batillaria attramentaria]|uniref:Uncharacterized protein n=1 Tax=Batillaria attramentaria TaxID=370345 RepID=A0ABD0L3F2_9CAEN